jgi:hypothetical protein
VEAGPQQYRAVISYYCNMLISGYTNVFRNLDNISGGGVGAYIQVRDDMHFKRLTNFEQLYPDLEVLWLEVPG